VKISEFNKQELSDYMKGNGEIHRFNGKSEAWKAAFKMYNKARGDRLTMDCGKCIGKVHDWLK
jgi:hypothetical protein